MDFDPESCLRSLPDTPDEEIDLAKAAIALAVIVQPGISPERYFFHTQKLSEETAQRHAELIAAGAEDNAETRLAALKHALVDINGYDGDRETYDDLQNANLIRVIERRKGLPIALSIVYVATGQSLGWDVCGLDFPGHFICRIEKDGRRLIFDPFNQCKILEAADLRSLLKKVRGGNAELSASYFEPAEKRQILIRLQNNIKYRQITLEDYPGALKTVELMRLVDPGEFRLLLDAGVLYARTHQTVPAIRALENYIEKAPADRDRQEAALLLRELKDSL